jgi:hypothetical protein
MATTGEVPLLRLEPESERLQPMPTPGPGVIHSAPWSVRRRFRAAINIRSKCMRR